MTGWRQRALFLVQAGLATAALVCGLAATPSAGLGQSSQTVTDAELVRGRELFNNHCASCHGSTGVGNGPLATAMRRSPPDVTALALSNGGIFPADRIRRIVDGRAVEAHGDREMPVWGDVFKTSTAAHGDDSASARIAAILKYLASIQRRQA
jgi:mono/diheme cytochrome c family protein